MNEKAHSKTNVQSSGPNSPADTITLFECPYGYHFPSSPTPSMLSELAKVVQKTTTGARPRSGPRHMLPHVRSQVNLSKTTTSAQDEEAQRTRISELFPTAPAAIVEQTVRAYHGREGLIKAALISFGYKRATDYGTQQATAQSPIMLMMCKPSSKKLFEKLVGFFPDKDESLIKSLMYKHNEVEHEIISVLVEDGTKHPVATRGGTDGLRKRFDINGAIMKLRYLKCLYPTCEENEIYHLLHCSDLNALKVMEIIESRGHKQANINEVLDKRKSQIQDIRAQKAAQAAKVKAPTTTNLIETHQKRTSPVLVDSKLNPLMENLNKIFPDKPEDLLLNALVSAEYNETLARKFVEQHEELDISVYTRRFELYRDEQSPVVLYPCKSTQIGGSNFMSVCEYQSVAIAKEVVECTTALALLKVDASTFTGDDFETERSTKAQGRRPNLATGPKPRDLIVRDSLHKGPDPEIRVGSSYRQLCEIGHQERPKPNSKATGRNLSLSRGPNALLKCGHNARLLERVHPFFQEDPRRPYKAS